MEAILFLATMGGLYAGLYYLNQKTPVPPGCENESVICGGCTITSCGKHPSLQDFMEEKS